MPVSGYLMVSPGRVIRGMPRLLWASSVVCLLVLATAFGETAHAAPREVPSTVVLSSAELARAREHATRSASHPASHAMARAGFRRGCWFADGSARLTRPCERQLRAAVKRLPRGTRVIVIGVSMDEPSAAQNRLLAKRRARAVVLYLRAIGVRGKLPRRTVIKRAGNAQSGLRPVTVAGSVRTTVIFGKPR